jgi:AcrR family transcriptional regulator
MAESAQVGRGLRQRTRDAVRNQIASVAMEMFDELGFEEITVDQIAAAVDISPRSFFRYFPSKEDVVLGDPMVYVEPVRQRLTLTLASMPVWDALRAALESIVEISDRDPEGSLRATRVMIRTPALRARNTEKHLAWMRVLMPLVEDALPGAGDARRYHAQAITLCALTCLDLMSAELVHRNGAVSSGVLLDDAFRLLKPAIVTD